MDLDEDDSDNDEEEEAEEDYNELEGDEEGYEVVYLWFDVISVWCEMLMMYGSYPKMCFYALLVNSRIEGGPVL